MTTKNSEPSGLTRYPPGPLYRFVRPRFWLAWAGLALMRMAIIFPLPVQLWLGRRMGEILYYLLPGRRFYADRNLELCFPDIDQVCRRNLLRESFRNLGMSFFETAMAWWASDDRLKDLCTIDGMQEVERGLAEGHGVILLTAHFASLDICGRILNIAGLSYDAMYRRHNNPLIEEVMRRGRERCAKTAIAKRDLRGIMRSLHDNRPVWYAPDQCSWGSRSELVPFFCEPALTSTATSSIARSSQARVVPFVSIRDGNRPGYRIKIQPALEDFPGEDPVADTLRINQVIESWIREYPEQYYWVHRRFKYRPEPHEDPYLRDN